MGNYLDELKNACEVSDPKGHLVYLKVQASKETATETESGETTGANE